jgi:hypothetical protein
MKKQKNLNRPIMSNGTKSIIESLSTKKSPQLEGFTTNSAKLIQVLLKLVKKQNKTKIDREAIFPNTFYKTSIVLIPKPDKDTTKKENHTPISPMNVDITISYKR